MSLHMRDQPESRQQDSEITPLLMSLLDRALDDYGSSVKQVVYWSFETTFGYDRASVFNHPREFQRTLEAIFGGGAGIVEKRISSEIKSARGLVGENYKDLTELFRAAQNCNDKRDLGTRIRVRS